MRSADEQKRDRTTNLLCSKLRPCSQTSNAGLFHRLSSALRQTITLCKTCIRDAVYRNAAKDCLFIRVGAYVSYAPAKKKGSNRRSTSAVERCFSDRFLV